MRYFFNQFLEESFWLIVWAWLYSIVHRIPFAIHKVVMFFRVVTLSCSFVTGFIWPAGLISHAVNQTEEYYLRLKKWNYSSFFLTNVCQFLPMKNGRKCSPAYVCYWCLFCVITGFHTQKKLYPLGTCQNQHCIIWILMLIWPYLGTKCSHHMTGVLPHM